MSDEVKEILDIENYRNKDGYVENIKLLPSEIHKLLDYITNLQEENEKLKELNVCVGCENNPGYKLRCEKAVNFINKTKSFIFNEYEEIISDEVVNADDVLYILEGKNNE